VGLEWGLDGARRLAPTADAVVVVDVLSFCTSVTVACERGARVWPHPGGAAADDLARSLDAVLAGPRSLSRPSLSPTSLTELPEGARLVLPSPNGSALAHALLDAGGPVVAGCLRNAAAVARHVAGARDVLVLPAGERWDDGSIRFAYEDLVGAGAVVDRLASLVPALARSPEAAVTPVTPSSAAAATGTASSPSSLERIDRFPNICGILWRNRDASKFREVRVVRVLPGVRAHPGQPRSTPPLASALPLDLALVRVLPAGRGRGAGGSKPRSRMPRSISAMAVSTTLTRA
jgi:2-phosphosulfolactate phosphatase